VRIGLINPNATRSMTDDMAGAAVAVAADGTEVVPFTARSGPASIESYTDEAYATTQVLDLVRDNPALDGYVIACASDPGLLAARELVPAPVVGIGEAGFLFATTLAPRFGVLTTLSRAIEQVWRQLAGYRLAGRCCSVRACGVAVLDTANPTTRQLDALVRAAREATSGDGAEAIVLGCGGMSQIADRMQAALGVPVVDGVRAAVTLTESLVRCGLRTSKLRTLAPPEDVGYLPPAVGPAGEGG
jgi:allantoin racemase